MTRPIAFFFLGCIATTSLVVACGDEETSPVNTTTAGPTSGQGGGLGGADFGVGGSGGSGAGQNVGGEGQATPVWNFEHGGAGAVFTRGLAIDPTGHIVVVGTYDTASGVVDLGGGPLPVSNGYAVFVAKYDSVGAHVWSKGFDGSDGQGMQDVACDSTGSIWVVGDFKGSFTLGGSSLDAAGSLFPDGFIAKLDANGNHVYSRAVGIGDNDSDTVTGVAVDADGNVVITGTFQSSIEFGGPPIDAAATGDYDLFVAKLDANGAHLFSKAFGTPGRQGGLGIAVGPTGSIAVGGYTTGGIDFGGGALTPEGDAENAVLAVLDADGNHVFSKLYPSSENARVTAVAFSPAGDVFATGNVKGTIDLGAGELDAPSNNDDILATRHDGTGALVYGVRFGGNGGEKASGLDVDADGYAVVSGWFNGELEVNTSTMLSTSALNDALLIRIGPPGNGFWGVQAHAIESAQARRVRVASNGDVLVVGDFSGEIDLGTGPVGSGAVQDMFLARFGP